MPSLAVLLAIGFSGSMTTSTSALSLGDVTNALGGVLGLNSKQSETTPAPTAKETPTQTQPIATQPAQTQSTLAQATPATSEKPATTTSPVTSQTSATPVSNVEQVTPATRDTGSIVKQVASAQTAKSIAPVSYTSKQISPEVRDELFAIAAVTTIVGAATYAMTYTIATQPARNLSRRPLYIK